MILNVTSYSPSKYENSERKNFLLFSKVASMTLFDLYLKDENLDAMKHLLGSAEFETMKNIQDTRNNYYFRKACCEYASGENLLVVQNTIDKMHFISEDYRSQALERVIKKA